MRWCWYIHIIGRRTLRIAFSHAPSPTHHTPQASLTPLIIIIIMSDNSQASSLATSTPPSPTRRATSSTEEDAWTSPARKKRMRGQVLGTPLVQAMRRAAMIFSDNPDNDPRDFVEFFLEGLAEVYDFLACGREWGPAAAALSPLPAVVSPSG